MSCSSSTIIDVCAPSYHSSDSCSQSSRSSSCSRSSVESCKVIPYRPPCIRARIEPPPCEPCPNPRPPETQADVDRFSTTLSPVTALTPHYRPANSGNVQFRMRRRNNTVTIQWEGFSGAVSQNGMNYLQVDQRLTNPPPYPMVFPIRINYKGGNRFSTLSVDPHGQYHLLFYLSDNPEEVQAGDRFVIPASSISWIVD